MRHSYTFEDVDRALPVLSNLLLTHGDRFASRAGGTLDVTHIAIALEKPWKREITLPERHHNLAAQIAETMWVLSGRDDVAWLQNYLPRAAEFSDDGLVWRGAYGPRIRSWGGHLDQLQHVVDLLRADHNTRRAVIAIYDPSVDVLPGKDIPCNDFLTFSIRDEELDLGVTIRSNDLIWGWSGINAFEWSVLQEIVADLVDVGVGQLHFSTTSLHLYERHFNRAQRIAACNARPSRGRHIPFHVPGNFFSARVLDGLFQDWFGIEKRIRDDIDVSVSVNNFPEPMLQSWLRVIQWWWTGDERFLAPLEGTRLLDSARVGVQPLKRMEQHVNCQASVAPATMEGAFLDYVTGLHIQKHNAYGDSWKRRGEMLGIMANIARKIDRLEANADTADENQTDTAIDLLVYLAKYRWWLTEQDVAPVPEGVDGGGYDPGAANAVIRAQPRLLEKAPAVVQADEEKLVRWLVECFERLEQLVVRGNSMRYNSVSDMVAIAYQLAYTRWSRDQSKK